MKSQDNIPKAVIRRLPHYLRTLEELQRKGINKISSKELSEQIGYTASQIRQDLNHFGGFGQQGYGYNVDNLYNEIEKILGLNKAYSVVIVGCGKLGYALTNFMESYEEGFSIAAVFDSSDKIIGTQVGKTIVQDVKDLPEFLKDNTVDIGVITVTKDAAQSVANTLKTGGVRGIWNFAPLDIQDMEEIPVENAHLSDGLRALIYYINH